MSVQYLVLSSSADGETTTLTIPDVQTDETGGNQKLLILSEASSRVGEFTTVNGEHNLIQLSEVSAQNRETVETLIFGESAHEVRAEELVYDDCIAAQIISEMAPHVSNEEILQSSDLEITGKKPKSQSTSRDHHTCEVCHKTMRSSSNLKRHYRIHTGERPYHCDHCGKTFAQIDHLKRHSLIHSDEQAFKCAVCLKGFKEKNRYIDHLRIHTGERPFVCTICHKDFTYKGGLVKHIRVHTGEKKYECGFCLKRFTESQSLRIHLRIHTGERPYTCKFCGKGFSVKKGLRTHVRIHTGERPFHCDQCWRTFISKSTLNSHKKIHLKIYPHDCKFCGKRFSQKSGLRSHVRVHMHSKPLQCGVCLMRFSHKANLTSHMKIHEDQNLSCAQCGKLFLMAEALEFHVKTQCDAPGGQIQDVSIHEAPNSLLLCQNGTASTALDTLAKATEFVEVTTVTDNTDDLDLLFPDRENSYLTMKILESQRPPKRERRKSV